MYSPWNSPGQNTRVGSFSLLQGIFPTQGLNPGIKPRSPAFQMDSLPAEPQGKPKNTEVGSLSFLQQIFPIQKSNKGLLHCRRILYQLSYQGTSAAAAAKSLQSCLTLCDPIDSSLPGFSVHGIFQARVLEWGAIAFSKGNP